MPLIEGISAPFVVFFFVVSLAFPITQLMFGATRELRYYDFKFLAAPLSFASITVTVFLQPRNNSIYHLSCLFVQAPSSKPSWSWSSRTPYNFFWVAGFTAVAQATVIGRIGLGVLLMT